MSCGLTSTVTVAYTRRTMVAVTVIWGSSVAQGVRVSRCGDFDAARRRVLP